MNVNQILVATMALVLMVMQTSAVNVMEDGKGRLVV